MPILLGLSYVFGEKAETNRSSFPLMKLFFSRRLSAINYNLGYWNQKKVHKIIYLVCRSPQIYISGHRHPRENQ